MQCIVYNYNYLCCYQYYFCSIDLLEIPVYYFKMWMNETFMPLNYRLLSIEDKEILCIIKKELRVHLSVILMAELFFVCLYIIMMFIFICFSSLSSLVLFGSCHYRKQLVVDISRRKILTSNSFVKRRNNINILLRVICLYVYTV